MSRSIVLCAALLAVAVATPAPRPDASSDEKLRSICAGDDIFACLQGKAMSYLESFFKKDSLKVNKKI